MNFAMNMWAQIFCRHVQRNRITKHKILTFLIFSGTSVFHSACTTLYTVHIYIQRFYFLHFLSSTFLGDFIFRAVFTFTADFKRRYKIPKYLLCTYTASPFILFLYKKSSFFMRWTHTNISLLPKYLNLNSGSFSCLVF